MSSIKVINTIRLCSKGVVAKDANGKYVKLHKRQGDMDGACSVYSLAMKRLSSTQSSIHTPSAWSISTTILLSALISMSTRKYSLSSSQLSTISLTVFLFIIHFVWGVLSFSFLFCLPRRVVIYSCFFISSRQPVYRRDLSN